MIKRLNFRYLVVASLVLLATLAPARSLNDGLHDTMLVAHATHILVVGDSAFNQSVATYNATVSMMGPEESISPVARTTILIACYAAIRSSVSVASSHLEITRRFIGKLDKCDPALLARINRRIDAVNSALKAVSTYLYSPSRTFREYELTRLRSLLLDLRSALDSLYDEIMRAIESVGGVSPDRDIRKL